MKSSLELGLEADAALGRLNGNSQHPDAYDRINDALDQIENNPHDHQIRQRRYATRPIFGTTIRTRTEDWLILWSISTEKSDDETHVVVHYIGPDLQ